MATEFNDNTHYGLFFGGGTLSSSTSFKVRQSELTLAAMRAGGLLDNMVDGTSPPTTDKFWLDKNTDPATLKEWDSIGLAWIPITFDRIFGRAVVTAMGTVTGTANAIIAPAPPAFIDKRLYSITPIATNTGAVTVQVPGYGTFNLTYPNGSALTKGELETGKPAITLFQNGRFELLIGYGPAVKAELWANVAAAFAAITSGAGFATREELKSALTLSDFDGNAYVTIDGQMIVLALDGGPLDHLDDGQIVFANGLGYKRAAGSTIIPDIPGWVPVEPATPMHFDVVNNGIIDCTAGWNAFQGLTGYRKEVQAGQYLVGDPIPEDGKPFVVGASGQSNMVAYSLATGGASRLPSNPNVHMWLSLTNGGAPQWVHNPDFVNNTYYPPIGYVEGYTGMGNGTCTLSLAFAHRLQEESGRPVWLIMDGLGGASLGQWITNGTSSVRYASLKSNIETAMALIPGAPTKIQFFDWQQGEANYLNDIAIYQAGLETLEDQLSAESWWASNTQFIAGLPNQLNPSYANITTAIRGFVAANPSLRKLADSSGLAVTGDNVHFTGTSLYTLGYERYWKSFVGIKRFDKGVLGNGDFKDLDSAWPQQRGDRERDSILVNSRTINYANTTDSQFSGPTIKTQTFVNLEVPSTDSTFTDFKYTFGSHHEISLSGYYDHQDDGNHNYSCSSFATRNNMAGLMGSTAAIFYSYDAKETENPNILTMGATKTGTAYMQTTRRARYASGGYTLGLEIYSLNQSDDVDTDVPYLNNDTGSFTSFDYSLKLTCGGAGAPITNAIAITGLGSKHGYYNGISIGGSAFRINNDTQGPTGTVSLNGATQRTATGFSEHFIKYGENKRHHYYVRENCKSRSAQHRFIYEAGSAGLSIEAGPGGSDTPYIYFRKGATTAKDANYATQTMLAQFDAIVSYITIASTAGYIRLNPNDTANGVFYDANTLRFATSAAGDGIPHLGDANRRWNTLYATNSTISTSDERKKTPIQDISDDVLDAWGDVKFGEFKLLDAVALKGDAARLHTGVIAQRVLEAFASRGLDASDYGLFCHDEWEAVDEARTVNRIKVKEPVYEQVLFREAWVDHRSGETVPAEYIDGEMREDAVYEEHVTVTPATTAGNLYSIRYEEALCMEAAYQRRRADRADARLGAIEARLSTLEAALAGAN